MDEEIIYILFGALLFVLIGIYNKLNGILSELQKNRSSLCAYGDETLSELRKTTEKQEYLLDSISSNLTELKDNLNDIKYVSDIYYKYKLPSLNERKLLDQIEIDNELSNFIGRS